eukprot:m51a1_g8340 hypothetical protein (871) ;mRNA; r:9862-16768
MLALREVVLSSCKDESLSLAWEMATGTVRATLHQNSPASACAVAALGPRLVAASQGAGKAAVHLWSWARDQPLLRCAVQEQLTALAATPAGDLLVGCSAAGNVFVWDVVSGELLRTWEAHLKRVSSCAAVGDGTLLATAGDDGAVHVWALSDALAARDGTAPTPLRTWSQHSLPVTCVASAAAGSARARVFTCSLDHTLRAWDVATGDMVASVLLPTQLAAVAVDPAERFVVVGGGDGRVYRVDLSAIPPPAPGESADMAPELDQLYVGHTYSLRIAFFCVLPSGSAMLALREVVLSSCKDESLSLAWEMATGTVRATLHQNSPASACAVAALGPRLVAASQGAGKAAVHLWSWARDQPLLRCAVQEQLTALAATPAGDLLVGCSAAGNVFVWDVVSGELLRTWEAHLKRVSSCAAVGDGTLLATAGDDGAVHVWALSDALAARDGTAPTPLRTWSQHSLPVTCVASAAAGSARARVFTCSLDHTLRAWDVATGDMVASVLLPTQLAAVAVDPAERFVVVGGGDGRVYRVDLSAIPPPAPGESADMAPELDQLYVGHTQAVTSVAVNADGTRIVSGSADGTVIVWDTVSRQPLVTFTQHKGPVTSVLVVQVPADISDTAEPPVAQLRKYLTQAGDSGPAPVALRPEASLGSSLAELWGVPLVANSDRAIDDALDASVASLASAGADGASSSSSSGNAYADAAVLREREAKWRTLTNQLYQFCLQNAAKNTQPLVTFTQHKGPVTSVLVVQVPADISDTTEPPVAQLRKYFTQAGDSGPVPVVLRSEASLGSSLTEIWGVPLVSNSDRVIDNALDASVASLALAGAYGASSSSSSGNVYADAAELRERKAKWCTLTNQLHQFCLQNAAKNT